MNVHSAAGPGPKQHTLKQEQAAKTGPLIVVLNSGSGNNATSEAQDVIARIFEEAGREHEFLVVDDAAGIEQTATLAVTKARARSGVVVAAGGDGTINAVAQAVLGSGCPFGVLPQGTFNYFARAHGIQQDTEASARLLLRSTLASAQVGLVNDRIFLVNASLGLYPRLLEDREDFTATFGRNRFVAIAAGIRTILRDWRHLRLVIEMEGDTRILVTPTLFVGNNALQIERLGFTGADALPPGNLAAIATKPIGSVQMLGLAMRGALGQLGEAEQVSCIAFHSLTVWPDREYRVKVGTDGEIREMRSPLRFRVSPEPLALLVPVLADRGELA